MWEDLQMAVWDGVMQHHFFQRIAGTMPSSPEPYLPEQHLEAMAREVGPGVFARWNLEDNMPDPAADPCLFTALLRPPVPAVQEADESGIMPGQLSFNHVNRWLTFALRDATV
eukprot:jgi/Ulvmu1/8324/UM042_0030.1